MVAVSRELFNRAIARFGGNVCQAFLHPHEPSCLKALTDLVMDSMKGSAKYFFMIFLAENAVKYKTLTSADIKPLILSYIRSVWSGVWATCSCVVVVCLYQNLIGRIPKDAIAYGMGLSSGFSVFISVAKRRPIMAYSLAALAVEALLRRMYRKVKRSKTIETIAFMVLNGVLMYKMRVTELARCNGDMWFFRPPRILRDKKVEEIVDEETGETLINACPHTDKACTREQCLNSILKVTSKYYVESLLFTTVKLLLTKPALRKSPLAFINTIVEWHNLRLSCFFGWYVGIYQSVSCLLCRWRKRDRAEHALIAGILAGLSYGMSSNMTLLGSVALYVARILGRELQQKYHLPNFYFVEINMILALAILINTRIFDPESTPEGFRFVLKSITNNRMEAAFSNFLKIMKEQIAKEAVM